MKTQTEDNMKRTQRNSIYLIPKKVPITAKTYLNDNRSMWSNGFNEARINYEKMINEVIVFIPEEAKKLLLRKWKKENLIEKDKRNVKERD